MLYVWKFFSNSFSDCLNKCPITRAAFLGHTHHLLVHSQLRPERPPQAPSSMALPGRLLPSGLVLLTSPAGPPGAPTARGRLFALSWGGLHGCQVQEPTGTCGASHTQHSGQHPPTALFTLDGPRVRSRTHTPLCVLVLNLIPVLPTGKLLSYSVPAAQRGCSFTHPSQEHRVLVGRLLQGYGAHLGRYPTRLSSQEPGTEPSLQSTPSPPVGQV